MFPNSDYLPTGIHERSVIGLRQRHVAANFAFPVLTVGLRQLSLTIGTFVPETPVNEDGDSLLRKNNVRVTYDA